MKIKMQNIGAHRLSVLHIPTHAAVYGPSTAGKSTIADAVCLAITGKDAGGRAWVADRLRNPDDPARVALTLDGLRVARVFRSRPGTAEINGDKYTSQTDIDACLSMVDRRELVRCIVAPFYWRTLLDTPKARAMRDTLLQALPPVDIRPIVAAAMADAGGLHDDDPLVLGKASQPDTAMHLQSVVNRRTDVAHGAYRAAVEMLEGVERRKPPQVDDDKVAKARATLALRHQYDAWQAHAVAVAQNEQRTSDHELHLQAWRRRGVVHDEREAQRVADWQTRRQHIGDEPAGPTGDAPDLAPFVDGLDVASVAVSALDAEISRLERAIWEHEQSLDGRIETAGAEHRRACVELQSLQSTQTCPTCGRGADEQAIARLQERVDTTGALFAKQRRRIEAENKQERARLDAALDDARQRLSAALENQAQCTHAHAMAKQAHDEHAKQARAVEMHRRRLQALGTKPTPVPFEEPEPVCELVEVPAAVDRPDVDPAAFAGAESVLAYDGRQRGDLDKWQKLHADAAAAVERAADASRALEAEADRVGALVRALREAPTTAASMQVRMLHDAMHASDVVRVRFAAPQEAGDVVSVSIEGRPWYLASTGMQVVADLALRDALRRLACGLDGLQWLSAVPLVVDCAQDWSGDLPGADALSGPTVYLYTDEGDPENGPDGLTVYDLGA